MAEQPCLVTVTMGDRCKGCTKNAGVLTASWWVMNSVIQVVYVFTASWVVMNSVIRNVMVPHVLTL